MCEIVGKAYEHGLSRRGSSAGPGWWQAPSQAGRCSTGRRPARRATVVFSGDTAPSDNLVELAHGADVLCHEVIDRSFIEGAFGSPPYTPDVQALVDHLLGAHTTIEDVGGVAERAGVRTLVLHHFVPGNNPSAAWLPAQEGYSGQLVIGEDLMQVGVGKRARAKVARG